MAFFNVNGYISILVFVSAWLGLRKLEADADQR